MGFEEALDIYGDLWYESLPLEVHGEYLDTLVEFSLGLLSESGFSSASVVSADVVRTGGNFANGFVNVSVNVVFAGGESATLSFWVLETSFTLIALEIDF